MHTIYVNFYTPSQRFDMVWGIVARTKYTHVSVSVDGLVFQACRRTKSGWYRSEDMLRPPSSTLAMETQLDTDLLDSILPPSIPYPYVDTLTNWIFGWPRYPLHCVGAAKRLLMLCGIYVKGRTPYGLYKEIKQRQEFRELDL